MSPYSKLAQAVIMQAFKDLSSLTEKEGAIAFLTSQRADWKHMREFWAAGACLDVGALESAALRLIGRA
jgi:hypothetical protein